MDKRKTTRKDIPNISDEFKGIVICEATKPGHKGYSANRLWKFLTKNIGVLYPLYKGSIPTSRSIGKIMKQYKPDIERIKADAIQRTWSMGALDDQPLEPGSLAAMVNFQKWTIESGNRALTIREMKWASRVYSIVTSYNKGEPDDFMNSLAFWTNHYSRFELLSEITGQDFNSKWLDEKMVATKGDCRKIRLLEWVGDPPQIDHEAREQKRKVKREHIAKQLEEDSQDLEEVKNWFEAGE